MARISIDIPDAKISAYLDDFIAANAIPLDANNQPTMSAQAWVKQSLIDFIVATVKHGRKIKTDAASDVNRADFS